MSARPKKKKKPFDFNNLFIFELSKNHGGDVAHGIRTVRAFAKVAKEAGVRAAVKLQFQNLDTYIHPSLHASEEPRMKRYFASRLSEQEFKKIVDAIHTAGLISMSTPFDEDSVGLLERLGVQVIKIASSSAADWPLLKRVARSRKPVVCSTGGLHFKDMDAVYRFFKKHKVQFAMLHCVSMYPTPPERMQLYGIALMRERYPDVPIGFSTHEPSDSLAPIQLAHALGARLFEKHVIVPDEKLETNLLYYKISTYTATPKQIAAWLAAHKEAVTMLGNAHSYVPQEQERDTLRTMTRGIFAKVPLKKGASIKRQDIYFAIPLSRGQLSAGEWRPGLVAKRSYKADEALRAPVRTRRK